MEYKFSFVVPTINQTVMLETCLKSLIEHNGKDIEIIVVDDGSREDIKPEVKNICERYNAVCIFNEMNYGFSKTINRGIENSKGDIIILTNNDIVFTQNVLGPYKNVFDNDDRIGIVGGLLFYPNGTIQHGGVFRYNSNKFLHRGWHKTPDKATEVYCSEYILSVTGALYAIRKRMIDEIGKMNEKYFLACEDTEYCLRAWKNGWKVFYDSNVRAIHAEGATRGNTPEVKMVKGRDWYEKERQGEVLFNQDIRAIDFTVLEKRINEENTKKKEVKIEKLKKTNICGVIGVNRSGALGDVILASGIIRNLKKVYPNCDIHFSTKSPDAIMRNPYISKVVPDKRMLSVSVFFDLDLAYEKNPKMLISEAYGRTVFGEDYRSMDLTPEMFSNNEDLRALETKSPPDFLNKKFVVVHMGVSWANRTWKREKWLRVIDDLIAKGYGVAVVGHGGDFRPDMKNGIVNYVGRLNVLEVRELIKKSSLCIGMDSGILHIGYTTNTPVIGLYTCANPDFRVPVKSGKNVNIVPGSCKFCLHDEIPPVTFVHCKHGTFQCLNDITPTEVIMKAGTILAGG